MKKSVLFIVLFTLLITSLIAAQNETTNQTDQASVEALDKVDQAYSCLENKVKGRCATLSSEEKIFVLLATGQCRDEVVADAVSGEYWTSATPSIKMTAEAILALDKSTNYDTKPAKDWLLTQEGSPDDVDWYLQIESEQATTCTITYGSDLSHSIRLREDKTLSAGAGNCLTLAQDDYWLKITPGCFDREFEISCDEDFLTALLFKRETSSIIHVSDQTHSASANGRTTEKVNSACSLQGGECNYEGSLWAAMVLNYKGYDVSAYIPYLTTLASENSQYLPESFLYLITQSSDYRTDLLSKQRNNKYWDEWKDKFYDTAIALYSISDEPVEKANSKQWLLEIQGEDGCWEGNVRNTAFVLSSIWPRQVDVSKTSCEPQYYCMSEVNCVGSVFNEYDCPGVLTCCSEPKPILTCSEQVGETCNVDESCVGGTVVDASDTGVGEKCCIGGTCEVLAAESECESYGGTCRPFECSSGEQESAYACEFGDLCCIPGGAEEEKQGGWGLVILFIILIILAILGIVFRKKLRPMFDKLVSKFKKKGPGPGPGMPGRPGPPGRPGMPPPIMRRPARRILPPGQKGSVGVNLPSKKPTELDHVLKKLKQMTKSKQ